MALFLLFTAGAWAQWPAERDYEWETGPAARAPEARIETQLQEVLSNSAFPDEPPRKPRETWLRKAVRWMTERLDFGPALRGLGTFGKVLSWVIRIALVLVIVYLLYLLVQAILRRLEERRDALGYAPTPKIEEHVIPAPDVVGYRELGEKALGKGDLRMALRYFFLAYLARLDRLGVLAFDPNRTNGEHLAMIPPGSGYEASLSEAVDVFDPVWYGYAKATSLGVDLLEGLSRPQAREARG